ncbi:MAG: hypothetical protein Q9188_005670 [Gyalolechia gomerana]
MTGTAENMALERIAIAHLEPAVGGSERMIEGVVTLIWPYSISNESFSILLAEPDFRLRSQRGQVRIHFTGSSASAVSRCDPKSGDYVTLRLLGAQWEKDETSSRTPGRGIEWQLRFEQRLVLRIQREDQEPVQLDIDHATPSPEPRVRTPSPPERTPMLQFSSTPILSSAMPPRIQAWSTPAFLKRNRLSSTTFFGSDYDPFDEDEFRDNSRRKKTKFGRKSNEWRFTERSTSSESVSEAETYMVQQPAFDKARDVQMNSHGDAVLSQKSNTIDTKRNAQSAEETLEITVTPGELKVVDDRQIPPSTDKRDISQDPVIASQIMKPSTVDEGVQTIHSGTESLEYVHQGAEAISVKDSAEGASRCRAPYRDGIDMKARPAHEQRTTDSISPTAKVATSLGLSEDGYHKTAKVNHQNPLNVSPMVENEPEDGSRRRIASPTMARQTLDGDLDEKQMLAEGVLYPEPTNDQKHQARQAAEHDFPHETLKPSDNKIFHGSPRASNDAATIEVVEATEEVQSTIGRAQQPSTPVVNQHPESDDPRLAEHLSTASPSQDQDLSSIEKRHIERNIPPEMQRSNDVEVFKSVQDSELEGLPTPSDNYSPDVVQESLVPQPKTAPLMQDEVKSPDKLPPTESVEDPQEQTEILEVLSESQEGDSNSEADQLIDEERQRLPGEADIEEETWSSEEESYPSDEMSEIKDSDDENEDPGESTRPMAAAVPRNSHVEVITLDDSDEDDGAVAQSQTDGAAISIPPGIGHSLSLFMKGNLKLLPNDPFLRDTIPDSQPLPVSLELEPPSEDNILPADADRKSPRVLDSPGDQDLPMPLDINDFEVNEQAELQPALPRGDLPIEDHIDPRLNNRVLTPNDTQPREDISQASDVSLHSIQRTHDLPTPQLTQNRSSDILLPASLRPSPPAILSLSPPVFPAKVQSYPTNKVALTAVERSWGLGNDVRASPRQSPRSRRVSTVPASVSPWFAPKRSSGIVPDSRSQSEAESEAESEEKIGEDIYSSYNEDEEETEDAHEEEISFSVPESRAESLTPKRLFQRKSPDQSLPSSPLAAPPGLRTSHAYYAPLSTLSSHFSTTTSTLSVVFAATPILRANSGPRDFYTTAYITDPSSFPATTHSTSAKPAQSFITTSIFRPSRSSLPDPLSAGSVLLLRSFNVTSSNRAPSLISTNSSAWAVFHPHNPDPIISGPPIEFGAEERGYVRGLWEWWDQLDAEVKADAVSAAEQKVRKAVRKDEREREKGRRLKGMGLRLAPGNEKGTGKHELRGGKEWKDDVGSSPKGKAFESIVAAIAKICRTIIAGLSALRLLQKSVYSSHDQSHYPSKPALTTSPHSEPSPTALQTYPPPQKVMPTKSFPITKSLRNHVDPLVTPYSILMAFRTDIWTLPKRDPRPTPPVSPRTKALDEESVGEEVAQALARLTELTTYGMKDEQQKEEEWIGVEDEENPVDEECGEGCRNLGRLGVKLGLRGGDAGVERNRYIDHDNDEFEGNRKEETLAWVRGSHLQGHGNDRGGDGEVKRPRSRYIDVDDGRSRVLKHVDRSSNLRGLKKRYDPDAESVYSRSTGGRSTSKLLIGDEEERNHVKEQKIRQSRYRRHRIASKSLAHGSQEEGERRRCLRASHVWRKRVHWADVGGYGTLVRCDGCHVRPAMWICDLQICGLGVCGQCKEKWEERREADIRWKEKLAERSRPRAQQSELDNIVRNDHSNALMNLPTPPSLTDGTPSSSKTSLPTSSNNKENNRLEGSRTFSATKRFGGDSTPGGKPPLNGIAPLTTTNVASPTTGASSAFGLGSGAFASFGTSAKTPKTPGTAIDQSPLTTTGKEREKDTARDAGVSDIKEKASVSSLNSKPLGTASEHPLRYTWIVWYRPPTSKFQDYEKSTIPLAHFSSAETFWTVYSHLKRPSSLPSVSDYHLFRKGIRPVWEDEENKRGGKWIIKFKKGVADRYWEDLLLAIVGDQFAEAGEEVCGAVLSVRSGEDVLSVWTRIDGGRNIKIRETIKRVLAFPPDTNIVWKSHDDSIAQRSAIDQARQEKGASAANHHGTGKRRQTMSEDPASEKAKG